ncbi:MAG: Asp-tRNA(Asn)/Glu-tRNA(Gln) amidotransferase subunit GatB [Deltaproteobacteria bacterium]|nr:Asp-tRNA(Asn)/Glu-tRNA(Gln) amidotransferase subunit GatB [Deltaproteobacteria bacterium]
MEFEPVIGLEVHAQLLTKSKLFCGCSTEFNAPANANVCPVCAGHPGTLPVLNAKAVEFALKAALALNCRVSPKSVFARKNYFYPDLPKGYQISQYDQPLCEEGHLDVELEGGVIRRIGLTRIHMEEDAGKSVHQQGYSLVNLNRAATPLIEIVSKPEIRSPEEAGAYLRKLRAVLMYLDVCDGNMQEGSFRCDANVSVKPVGSPTLGTRAEIKNVNSFRFVEKAIEYEINRQIQLIQSGGKVVQETRTYDSGKNVTISMRGKEEAHDYRYFPDPDLVPIAVTEAQLAAARASLPELPDQKRDRFVGLGIPAYDAAVITSSKRLAQFCEDAVAHCGEARAVANWVTGEMLRLLKQDEREVDDLTMKPSDLGTLVKLIKAGTISNTIAKTVFEEMYKSGQGPESIVREKGLVQISDTSAILQAIDKVIAGNSSQVAEYRSGKDKVFGFLVGQVMKQMGGKANPGVVNELLKKRLTENG